MTSGFFPDIAPSVPGSFETEVTKGNVPGHSIRTVLMRNPSASGAEEDVWGGGGNMTFPTVAETWEILSTSPNDNIAGTGARLILINSLDANYDPQIEIAVMNGTTAVVLTNSNFRPDDIIVINSGSSHRNEGDITVQVSVGGAVRRFMPAIFSVSQDCHFTVPLGFSAISLRTVFAFPSGNSGEAAGKFNIFGTNTEITTGKFPFFEGVSEFNVEGQFLVPEKTDVRFTANSTPVGAIVNLALVVVLIDNNFL